jgi:hypothetical protein
MTNIAELLKDCPRGMELDCTMFDNVTFVRVDNNKRQFPIEIAVGGLSSKYLTKEGCFHDNTLLPEAKCVIFPKGKTTWDGFQRPFKDGDIVTWKDRGSLIAFIYKERKNVSVVKYHFALYAGSLGTFTDGEIALVESQIVFATEEEKQKLFDAIKANGYKWNDETKTLEKLIEPKFKVGDIVKSKNCHKAGTFVIIDIKEDAYSVNLKQYCIKFKDQDNFELVSNKFGITTLKPFDKVLVRDNDDQLWTADMFGFYRKNINAYPFVCVAHYANQCIPYEENKHLLGTTDDCVDYYKTWE